MPRPLLFFILILEGFITISIEILAIRSLLPFVGNSVVITSLIIGIFLLFLSLGYFRGGTHQVDFEEKLSKNFLIAATITGIGLSFVFISYLFWASIKYLSLGYLTILTIYLLLVIAPIVYLLGQTIPITTNLFKQNNKVSKISGNALFINTLGSFLGAVLTSLVLLHFFGVAMTVLINCALMLLLSFSLKIGKLKPEYLFGGVCLLFLIYQLNVDFERFRFIQTNNYGNYRVQKEGNNKTLFVNFSPMSRINPKKDGFAYVEKLREILFHEMKLKDKSILVIGAGGFTLSAKNDYGNHFTYLDIDNQIQALVEKYFLMAPINGKFIAADARQFFHQDGKPFDVIISDVFQNINSLPSYLMTTDYLKRLYTRLSPEGLAIFNIISSPFLEDNFSKGLDNTIKSVFKNCARIPISFNSDNQNILYLCKKSPYEGITTVYKDDLNHAEWDQVRRSPIFKKKSK